MVWKEGRRNEMVSKKRVPLSQSISFAPSTSSLGSLSVPSLGTNLNFNQTLCNQGLECPSLCSNQVRADGRGDREPDRGLYQPDR